MYHGCLEDGTEVAVKMRSESSTHGLDEFLAEVIPALVDKICSLKSKASHYHSDFTCKLR